MSKRHTKKGAYIRTRKSELRAEAQQYDSDIHVPNLVKNSQPINTLNL